MPPCDRLTAKEIEVAGLVWEGRTNRQIASVVGTTEQVVKNYLRSIFDKLGVWSRLELALYVADHGGASWGAPTMRHVEATVLETPRLLRMTGS
jgi:DNA-binding NarL/FixJ family response regulator